MNDKQIEKLWGKWCEERNHKYDILKEDGVLELRLAEEVSIGEGVFIITHHHMWLSGSYVSIQITDKHGICLFTKISGKLNEKELTAFKIYVQFYELLQTLKDFDGDADGWLKSELNNIGLFYSEDRIKTKVIRLEFLTGGSFNIASIHKNNDDYIELLQDIYRVKPEYIQQLIKTAKTYKLLKELDIKDD